jgi:N-methylhydantoinase A
MTAEATATLAAEGYTGARARLAVHADLRYLGQGSELTVPLPAPRLDAAGVAALHEAFAREYTETYGYATGEAVELVNLRLVATGVRAHRLDLGSAKAAGSGPTPAASRPARRAVAFARGAPRVDTAVVARDAVPATPRRGPLVVESYDSTVVVPPDAEVATDAAGNLVITLGTLQSPA